MGDVQTCGQSHGHSHAGGAGAANHSPTDGVKDNKAAVAEHGDGDDPAHELDGQLGVLLPHQLDDHVGQLQGGTGLLQDGADQGTQDDDDTDGAEGTGEAGTDDACDITQRDTGDQSQDQGHAHDGQERMYLELGDCDDHYHNCQNKCDNQGKACHNRILLTFFEQFAQLKARVFLLACLLYYKNFLKNAMVRRTQIKEYICYE